MIDKTILVDLDGTLADYLGALVRDLDRLRSPGEEVYPPFWSEDNPDWHNERINLVRRVPGWWEALEPLASGFQVLEEAIRIGFNAHILTKNPYKLFHAANQKLAWCDRYVKPVLGVDEVEVSISPHKARVYGRVLFDDDIGFMAGWLEHRKNGLGIMTVQDHNRSYTHPQVVKWDGTNLGEVVDRLQLAYDC
ncbi:hypothetical protein HOD38_05070 [archaeon]|jgi:5'-nucleotidase|nr:hypothetical protein [archaeon]MBT4397611.1 hypothetical protein [archaeon]MBT4441090.1 hypothetical protein [archaeon]